MGNGENWFKKTESLLYNYKTYDSAIKVLEAELQVFSVPCSEDMMPRITTFLTEEGRGRVTGIFYESETEFWGIERAEASWMRRERVKKILAIKKSRREAIKEARGSLEDGENLFINLRYDKEKSHEETIRALAKQGFRFSRRGYFYMRKETVGKVAKFLGVL